MTEMFYYWCLLLPISNDIFYGFVNTQSDVILDILILCGQGESYW